MLVLLLLAACRQQQPPTVMPWGEAEEAGVGSFDLDDIEHSGELIVLTLSGPDTYYDYHGRALGVHAILCQQFADSLGVSLRLVACRDSLDLTRRLAQGEADLAACPLAAPTARTPGWRVAAHKPLLAEALAKWYAPARLEEARAEEQRLLTTARVKRRVYAPMLNQKGGVISRYDALFVKYGRSIDWDWRLMAAQCYQESTFDPDALSWAGARGLMQIMPQTADHLGLPRHQMNDPEQNIAAAARYLKELEQSFNEISQRRERQDFVLASYNGGPHHVRDAMALARRDGKNAHRWADVAPYVLRLSKPEYYQDSIVKSGYMRGSETVDYVRLIRSRYQQYRGVKAAQPGSSSPKKSRNERHRSKYSVGEES